MKHRRNVGMKRAREVLGAQGLLIARMKGSGFSDDLIAKELGITLSEVTRWRGNYVFAYVVGRTLLEHLKKADDENESLA